MTGLVWLKDAGCLPAANWAAAITEVSTLAAGQCGWPMHRRPAYLRLPNLNELESLVDISAAHPALTPGNPFLHVSTGIYWSSTSYFGGQAAHRPRGPSAWMTGATSTTAR